MINSIFTLKQYSTKALGKPMDSWILLCAQVLAGMAIITSAFHFWPFENSKTWQMLCPPNAAIILWILVLIGYFLIKRGQWTNTLILPHISVLAYLAVNILSISFAADVGRAVSYTGKLTLMFIGGYMLFSTAIYSFKSLSIVYKLLLVAAIMSITCSLLTRFKFGFNSFGFFGSSYKYGSYVGILAPFCSSYLLLSTHYVKKLLAFALVIGAFISSGSLGGIVAIVIGISALTIIVPKWPLRFFVLFCLASGIGLVILLNSTPALVPLRDDIKVSEKDNINPKQRYIEWQAELNLLEERTITGTAAGCINDYRSNFYYRLPKLNTLKAFDQNGWLATSAETGILGLVCFCWIILRYLKLAYLRVTTIDRSESLTAYKFAVANFVGLVVACVANLFSSIHYNGVLIILVLLLAIISRSDAFLLEKDICESEKQSKQ